MDIVRPSDVPLVVQGDTSGCSLGLVDIKIKVVFYVVLKQNFCFDVNRTLNTS